ncbi:10104_t:CDS:10 [Diversispora eburnea]|uniref:10104_t:CDS:1 n=1 Tax=Diversispora eburnea TaxID=1213867 RepID=A0A9N9AUK8_9GLOM|nr:10104_t:CDS:10 [Diversispora eburnea]
MTFNKNNINTENEAKEDLNYYGGPLKPEEKMKTETMGLTTEGKALLNALLVEQKGNSVPYQVVSLIGSDTPVDKVIRDERDKEIKKLQAKYNQKLLDEQTNLETNVDKLVTKLKDDLKNVGSNSRKFIESIIKFNERYEEEINKPSVPASATSYGSVIKTGYSGNGKPYTHPLYLGDDLPVFENGGNQNLIGVINDNVTPGADNSITTKNYVIDGGSANLLRAPFPVEKKELTWANGKIPDEILSKDVINYERVREEPISVYEKKLVPEESTPTSRYLLRDNYEKYIGSLIRNEKDTSGKPLIDVDKLGEEWKAKALTYDQLKSRISEYSEYQALVLQGEDIDKAKRLSLEENGRKLGDEWIKRNDISSKLVKVQQELDNAQKLAKTAKTGRMQESSYPADPTFNVTALRQNLDNEEKTRGETERSYLTKIKNTLKLFDDLTVTEKNELEQITNYLNKVPTPTEVRITPSDLKAAFGMKTNIFRDAEEIKKIADKVNGSGTKIKKPDFVKYLKENLSTKPDLPKFPTDNVPDQQKLDWFWSLDPEIVIGTIASQELVADSSLKDTTLTEMKAAKDGDKVLDSSKYKKDDKGEFTEEAISLYYSEKLGGINHSFSKTEEPKEKETSQSS